MNHEPIMGVIARVRRAMPRNSEVMLICDRLEELIVAEALTREGEAIEKAKFDKREYMREYMRQRRAK